MTYLIPVTDQNIFVIVIQIHRTLIELQLTYLALSQTKIEKIRIIVKQYKYTEHGERVLPWTYRYLALSQPNMKNKNDSNIKCTEYNKE